MWPRNVGGCQDSRSFHQGATPAMDRIEGHNLMVHDGFPFNGKKKKVCHRLPEKIIIPIIPLINVEVWLVWSSFVP